MSLRASVRNFLLVVAMGAVASTDAMAQERLWLDVNLGAVAPTDKDYGSTSSQSVFGETATFAVDYKAKTGFMFDVGAGFLLTPQFGVGINVAQSRHKGAPTVSATIPHPFLTNRSATGSLTGEDLERTDTAVNIQAMFVAWQDDSSRFRIFAGPTYMQVKNENVQTMDYRQTFTTAPPANTVVVNSYTTDECTCTGWGFNVGADYSYFFSPNVGVGGILRYTRANVEPADLNGTFELTAGGVAFGGGLRVKF